MTVNILETRFMYEVKTSYISHLWSGFIDKQTKSFVSVSQDHLNIAFEETGTSLYLFHLVQGGAMKTSWRPRPLPFLVADLRLLDTLRRLNEAQGPPSEESETHWSCAPSRKDRRQEEQLLIHGVITFRRELRLSLKKLYIQRTCKYCRDNANVYFCYTYNSLLTLKWIRQQHKTDDAA